MTRSTRVVVPCYNEASRLEPNAFVQAIARDPALAFVMVDDGSSDGTATILEELAKKAPERIDVVVLERNVGKAEAVRRGVLRAFELGAEIAGYWDADLATPLSYISEFATLLGKDDVVMVAGSRVRMLGHRIERSAIRHYIGRGFGTLAALALGLPVYDTQCGAKLFKTTAAIQSAFESPFTLRWAFDVELLARLLARETEVGDIEVERQCIEFPLEEWRDAPGSKITVRQLPKIALEIAKLYVTTRSARKAHRR